ncbi:hypothetical protein AX23_03645 [Brucella melitensis 548]|nr:hypothetical protein AX23_03645 [Brucella melitensis 548]
MKFTAVTEAQCAGIEIELGSRAYKIGNIGKELTAYEGNIICGINQPEIRNDLPDIFRDDGFSLF